MSSTVEPSVRDLDDVATRIRQHHQSDKRPVLLVEGPTDKMVLQRQLDTAPIFPAGNKNEVIKVFKQLTADHLIPAVGVVDADFDSTDQLCASCGRVILYDERDLESMLIRLGVLATLVNHMGSEQKLKELGGAERLIELLRDRLKPVTALRYVNSQERWGLAFDKVPLESKIDRKTLELKVTAYCDSLLGTIDSEVPRDHLITAATKKDPLDERGPRGRDLLEIVAVALRGKAGTQKTAVRELQNLLESSLHAAADKKLSETSWINELKNLLESLERNYGP